jgi:AAHS family 4-hydroxybenzoate transporter-like MFS transporter
MMVVLMFVGITIGGGLPSLVAAGLVPRFGWQVLFVIGGIFPLAVAGLLAVRLPESVKFLAARPDRRDELIDVLRRMRPELGIPDDARFEAPAVEPIHGLGGFRQVFAGDLRWITPLIWTCFAATLMSNFFLNSWMPVLFERTGLSPEDAAFASGLYHVGGTMGGLMISVLIDRCGVWVVAMFLGMAAPAVAAIGIDSLSDAATLALSLVAGIGVLGAQFGNNASAALIYPSEIRARAVGLAFAVGRLGSIAGPLFGGYVLAKNYPMDALFRVAAIPLLVAMVAAGLLTWLCYRRYGGLKLGFP